jgi:mannosyl-3-phosphoglycerate phosphatase
MISKDTFILIYSDLDGTLLDHHSYAFDEAKSALERLKQANIPVILNTSKTAAEVLKLRDAMHLDTPFITENGAAVYIPTHTFPTQPEGAIRDGDFDVLSLASPRSHWIEVIEQLKPQFGQMFQGFNDMSLTEISEATGLSEQDALLASQRLYGEPLLWKGSIAQRDEFIERARALGACPLLGGRFLHICGDTNKGYALKRLTDEYTAQFGLAQTMTIALGDGNNDIAMLEAADIGVRILSPVNAPPTLSAQNTVITSTHYGPAGWQESIDKLIPFQHTTTTQGNELHG